MKGFRRTETLFSLCGLNRCLCTMYLGRYCPGCGGGEGNQSCPIAKCSLDHGGIAFCWECCEYPCSHYDGFDQYDSFVPHVNRVQDIKQFHLLGASEYLSQMKEKKAILDELLAYYNDGRRKTFFCISVYLFSLEDLCFIIDQLHSRPELLKKTAKDRSAAAVALFNSVANRKGIILKLRKKPKPALNSDLSCSTSGKDTDQVNLSLR